MPRDFQKEAEARAKARVLKIINGSVEDGRQIVIEAISEDASALRSITSQLYGTYQHGFGPAEADWNALGKLIAECVDEYALRVAEARHWVEQELAEIHEEERDDSDARIDDYFEEQMAREHA